MAITKPTHGGARPGSGRKKMDPADRKPPSSTVKTIRVRNTVLAKIDNDRGTESFTGFLLRKAGY